MTTAVALGVNPACPRTHLAPRRASRARGPARSRAIVPHAGADDDGAKPASATGPNSVLSALCPLLKVFSGGDAAAPRNRVLSEYYVAKQMLITITIKMIKDLVYC